MSATKATGAGLAVKLIGTCEAARILGVHRNTIGHWAQNGILRACMLPTGARRFDRDEVQRVRAQIHPQSPHDAPHLADSVLLAGKTGSGKASMLWSRLAAGTERQILVRVDRAIRIGERELRYQLDRKDNHPLANERALLDVLAELEDLGLVERELSFRLTARGRDRLAELAQGAGWST
jgi:excisionase family DNA binding protein